MINWTWVIQVLVPYLALMSLFIIVKGKGGDSDFYSKIIELGVETGILGIGVSAAVFGSPEAKRKIGDNTLGAALLVLFVDFFIIAISAHIKGWPKSTVFRKALISTILGSLIFGINTGVVTFISEYATLIPSIFYGIWAGVTPVATLLVIRYFLKPIDQT